MNTFKKVSVLFGLFLITACGGGGGGMGSDDPYTPPTTPTPGTGMTAIDKTFVITVAPTQAYGATGNRYYVMEKKTLLLVWKLVSVMHLIYQALQPLLILSEYQVQWKVV